MKLLLLSDIHFEFMKDNGQCFFYETSWPNHDICIIAGDLGTASGTFLSAINIACDVFEKVVFVAGNHEYYNGQYDNVKNMLHSINRNNYYLLDNSTQIINNQRFIGGTMWYPENDDFFLRRTMNDFYVIADHYKIYEENAQFRKMINNECLNDDIVITHHLPSYKSVAPKFQNANNCFFVCDHEKEIIEKQPKLWLHGHTHSSHDYMINNTRIVANPFGYLGENKDFNDQLVIEI